MRIFFIIFLITLGLVARDNPFFPTDPTSVQMTTSNRVENLKPFSTQTMSLPNSARAIKAITITYQNLDGSLANETLEVNNKVDWHEPFIISQKQEARLGKKAKQRSKSIKLDFIQLTTMNKSMKIRSNDIMIRNFMMTSPYRLVMDFSRDISFRPKEFILNKAPFSRVRMGAHNKYYRVVLELDGQYVYSIKSSAKEMILVFK